MSFDSLAFIYMFLPLTIIFYYIVPNRFKNAALLVVSLLFYSFSEPLNMLLMIASIGFDYSMSYSMRYANQNMKLRLVALLASIAKNLLLIIYVSISVVLGRMEMPIGINIYTLTALGYMVDVYKGDIPYEENIIDFGLFCSFFAKIFVGPLVTYEELRLQLKNKRLSLSLMSNGIIMFTYGLAKKIIIAETMYNMYYAAREFVFTNNSVLTVWIMVISLALAVYFELSSYCDMARGIANIFSINLPRNFYYPYQALSVRDFFSRFNMTVYKYINTYVYTPLGEDQNGTLSTIVNIIIACMLMGMWFGIYTNYALWGVYLAIFVILEHFVLHKYLSKIPQILCRAYTFVVVISSFTIFASSYPAQIWYFLSSMFGRQNLPIYNENIIYLLWSNYVIFAVALVFITSVPFIGFKWLEERLPRLMSAIKGVVNIMLLILATAYLI